MGGGLIWRRPDGLRLASHLSGAHELMRSQEGPHAFSYLWHDLRILPLVDRLHVRQQRCGLHRHAAWMCPIAPVQEQQWRLDRPQEVARDRKHVARVEQAMPEGVDVVHAEGGALL